MKILVADDNPDDRALAERELQAEFGGVLSVPIGSPADLEAALADGKPDLVVSDFALRWGDGIELIRKVKEKWPDCPGILFTGTGSEETAVDAMRAGLDDYVLKSRRRRLGAAARRALRESERRYRRLFHNVPIGLFIMSADGFILDANPALKRLLGWGGSTALAGADIRNIHAEPTDRQRWLAQIGEMASASLETPLRRQDGSAVTVLMQGRRLCMEDRQIDECAVTDISGRMALEGDLREAVRQKNVLLRELNHRCRNQAALATSLLTLRSRLAEGAVADEFREMAERLRVLARLQDKIDPDHLDEADMAAYLRELAESMTRLRKDLKLALRIDLPDRLAMPVDRAIPLSLVAYEILMNVAKHAFRGRSAGEVRIHYDRSGNAARLRFEDNGVGYEPTTLRAGSMGLDLLRRLSDQADANLDMRTEPGRGTRIVLTLRDWTGSSAGLA
jgi:PAS domain S-box-containing protein